jgi:hypothetical protein
MNGKQFILFINHKLLESLGHLHTKTLNRLQAALLEHDFVVQYKKETTMSTMSLQASIATGWIPRQHCSAFNPFQANFPGLQNQDPDLKAIFQFIKTVKWLLHFNKRQLKNTFHSRTKSVFWQE